MTFGDKVTGTVLVFSAEWRQLAPAHAGRKCRQPLCPQPAVYELNRKRWASLRRTMVDEWWAYCKDHTYGHVWIDGEGMWLPINLAWSGDQP